MSESTTTLPPGLQEILRDKTPEQRRLILQDWHQINALGDGPAAWGGRCWRFTPAEVAAILGRPVKLAHLRLEDEYEIEKRAMMVYAFASLPGLLLTGIVTAAVVGGWSWRTAALMVALILCGGTINRLLVCFLIWPFECNYRRLIGQFHDGNLPPRIRADAAYWPVALLRKLAPAGVAVGFVLALNKLAVLAGL